MIRAILIPTLLLLAAAAVSFAAVSPLSESERTRLEAVADGSTTVDEAGFYALLENTTRWPADESGSPELKPTPDYQQLLDRPADFRGQLCEIEGVLYQVHTVSLSHSGWQAVRDITLDVSRDPSKHQFITLYLTAPPDFNWWIKKQDLPIEYGAKVHLLARFYKAVIKDTLGSTTKASTKKSFPVFVGRTLTIILPPPAPDPGKGRAVAIVGGFIAVIAAAFLVFRVMARKAPVSQMDIYRQRKEERRQQRASRGDNPDDAGDEETADETLELADPGEALNILAARHDEPKNPEDETESFPPPANP